MESVAVNKASSNWLVAEETNFSDKDISSDVEIELYSRIYHNENCGVVENEESDIKCYYKNNYNCSDQRHVTELNSKSLHDSRDTTRKSVHENDWRILGKSDNRQILKRSLAKSCFSSFEKSKSTSKSTNCNFEKTSKNIKKNENGTTGKSSEYEIVLEASDPAVKSKSDSSVIVISDSSDDEKEFYCMDETSSVNENFTLNIVNSSVIKFSQNSEKKPSGSSKSSKLMDTSKSLNKSIDSISPTLVKQKNSTIVQLENGKKINHKSFSDVINTTGSISKNLWSLNSKDKFKESFQETLLYKEKSKLNKVKCHNCKECGHLSKHCKKPKRYDNCFLCGNEGHNGEDCPNPVCRQCQRVGHTLKYCLWGSDDLKYLCSICKTPGHLREECPDMWRRYCLTTETEINRGSHSSNNTKLQSCCNCGRKGHTGNICSSKTMDGYIFLPSLQVFSYSNPGEYADAFSKKVLKKEDKTIATLFNKKTHLANLANEKYRKTASCGYSSKRARTHSEGSFRHNKFTPLRKDVGNKFLKRSASLKTFDNKRRSSQPPSEKTLKLTRRQRRKLKSKNSKVK